MSSEKQTENRRFTNRHMIERIVRYRVLESGDERETGLGKTLNMSSNGVLITTERRLTLGQQIELAMSWPAQMDNGTRLKLVAWGNVTRSEPRKAGIQIEKYEFRTLGREATV